MTVLGHPSPWLHHQETEGKVPFDNDKVTLDQGNQRVKWLGQEGPLIPGIRAGVISDSLFLKQECSHASPALKQWHPKTLLKTENLHPPSKDRWAVVKKFRNQCITFAYCCISSLLYLCPLLQGFNPYFVQTTQPLHALTLGQLSLNVSPSFVCMGKKNGVQNGEESHAGIV